MPIIQLDSRLDIHYHAKGAGPDVVLIHGLGSSLRMWERPLQRLAAAGLRAWAVDLPGSGSSSVLNSPYTIPSLANTVETFAGYVGIERAALVGHSMGGAITLEMARRRPEFVRALVLVAPVISGRFGFSLHVLLGSTLGRRGLELLRRHSALLWPRAHPNFALPWRGHPALIRDVEDLARTAPQAFWGGLSAVLDFDSRGYLPSIHAPALVIVGARDATVPPAEGELAAARMPRARLVKMKNAGHRLVDECPAAFDCTLVEFLLETCRL